MGKKKLRILKLQEELEVCHEQHLTEHTKRNQWQNEACLHRTTIAALTKERDTAITNHNLVVRRCEEIHNKLEAKERDLREVHAELARERMRMGNPISPDDMERAKNWEQLRRELRLSKDIERKVLAKLRTVYANAAGLASALSEWLEKNDK